MLTTKLDVHSCQQNGLGKVASARCHQHPAHCQQVQELEADGSAGVLGLTFLKGRRVLDKAFQGSKSISLFQALASVD